MKVVGLCHALVWLVDSFEHVLHVATNCALAGRILEEAGTELGGWVARVEVVGDHGR